MYGQDTNLVANPINRFSIGNRTAGMKYDADGGLTLQVQAATPEKDTENWLPAPKGNFYVILRCYMPGKEIVSQTWSPPALVTVKQ